MIMSTVFSELSLDYASVLGGDNQISLFRIRTNDNNTNNVSGLVLTPLNAVPSGQRHLFEIQVVPTGDTGRIINNTFGAGYTRMDSFKRLTHRIERAVADAPGTTSGSLTCTVNVRRIAFHADNYSRQMILNHSITTVGSTGGGEPPPPPAGATDDGFLQNISATYFGVDNDIGTAQVQLFLNFGSITAIERSSGQNPNNTFYNEYALFTFDANSPIALNAYEATIEVISITGTVVAEYLNLTNGAYVRQTTADYRGLWEQSSTGGGSEPAEAVLRITVRRVSDQVVVMRKRVRSITTSIN